MKIISYLKEKLKTQMRIAHLLKLEKGGISLKQYNSENKKTSTIYLTNEEVIRLASELSTKKKY